MAARKIVITSGKGGVGKTTVTAKLGQVLSSMGFRVLLVDADIGLNNLDMALGVEKRRLYDFVDIIEGKCRPHQAIIKCGDTELFVLPSGADNAVITAQAFRNMVDSLTGFDFVLIDCPAGIENGFHRAVSAANEALVVANPAISSVRDADKVLALLSGYELDSIGIVINRINGGMVMSGEMMSATDIAQLLRYAPVGIIPDNTAILLDREMRPINSDTVWQAFYILAENVAYGKCRHFDYTSKHRGFFAKFRKNRN